jgi:hypothetical protein
MPPARSSSFRLFVEGKDDLYSITELLQRHGYDWNNNSLAPLVYDSGGIEPLFEALPAALKTLVRVGVVIDADLSASNRWARMEAILKTSGIAPPPWPSQPARAPGRNSGRQAASHLKAVVYPHNWDVWADGCLPTRLMWHGAGPVYAS